MRGRFIWVVSSLAVAGSLDDVRGLRRLALVKDMGYRMIMAKNYNRCAMKLETCHHGAEDCYLSAGPNECHLKLERRASAPDLSSRFTPYDERVLLPNDVRAISQYQNNAFVMSSACQSKYLDFRPLFNQSAAMTDQSLWDGPLTPHSDPERLQQDSSDNSTSGTPRFIKHLLTATRADFSSLINPAPRRVVGVVSKVNKLLLATGVRQLEHVLAHENAMRYRWIVRAGRFVWLNYEKHAFGSPEMDPRLAKASHGEWYTLPQFIYDNLDSLHSLRLWDSEQKTYRYLEIATVVAEAVTREQNYLTFRNLYMKNFRVVRSDSFRPPPLRVAHCKLDELYQAAADWVDLKGDDVPETEVAKRTEHLASVLDDGCLPEWVIDSRARDNSLTGTVDHLSILRQIAHFWPTFNRKQVVSFFETVIRSFGGVLSGFALTGQPIALYAAWDCGHRLSYNLFNCADQPFKVTEMCPGILNPHTLFPEYAVCFPNREVNLTEWRSERNSTQASAPYTGATLAVIASNQLEFKALSDFLGLCDYTKQADLTLWTALFGSGAVKNGLWSTHLSVDRNAAVTSVGEFGLGAENDSAYEYVVKRLYHQHNDSTDWPTVAAAKEFARNIGLFVSAQDVTKSSRLRNYHKGSAHPKNQEHWVDQGALQFTDQSPIQIMRRLSLRTADNQTEAHFMRDFTHLGCFLPGMLSLMADHPEVSQVNLKSLNTLGEQVAEGCASLYYTTVLGIAPEEFESPGPSLMRPEVIEGLTYQWYHTKKLKFRNLVWQIFDAQVSNHRVPFGFCSVTGVDSTYPTFDRCRQDTWILAETIKYLLLAFSPAQAEFKPLVDPEILRTVARTTVAEYLSVDNFGTPVNCTRIKRLGEVLDARNFRHTSVSDFWVGGLQQGQSRPLAIPPGWFHFEPTTYEDTPSATGNSTQFGTQISPGFVLTTEAHPLPVLKRGDICSLSRDVAHRNTTDG